MLDKLPHLTGVARNFSAMSSSSDQAGHPMKSSSNDPRQVRDAAIAALNRAFDSMDPETGEKILTALDDPERLLTLAIWLPNPRVDICAVSADGEMAPELIYSRPFVH
jgi:hypothetical protein